MPRAARARGRHPRREQGLDGTSFVCVRIAEVRQLTQRFHYAWHVDSSEECARGI
jgi:hypothetical protein